MPTGAHTRQDNTAEGAVSMQPEWVPPDVDVERPSVARVYDYLLGGSHNFAADRDVARAAMAAIPDITVQAQANRAFLHRAVRYLADLGVWQFLDLGSGIPTLGNVHEIAQKLHPDARVVYVDIDPVAVAHSRHILTDNTRATVVHADLRDSRRVLADEGLRRVLDLSQPVAVLAVAVLHSISDADEPAQIIARYRDAIVPGSYLVIAHGTDNRPEDVKQMAHLLQRSTTPVVPRTAPQIEAMFDGFDLVEPGLVWAPLWHPESPHEVPPHPDMSGNLAGVGHKR
jgi:SAM-dependent methyltransferase